MSNNFELARSFFYQGEENYSKKNYKDAEKNFLLSLNLLPNRISTLVNLGLTQIKLNKIKEVSEVIEKIELLLDNKHDEEDKKNLLNLKSIFYGETNNFSKSIEVLNQLIIHPKIENYKISEYYSYMGIAYSKLENYKKNIELQKKSIEINPDNIFAKFNLGLQYLKFEDYKKGWFLYEYRLQKNKLSKKHYPENIIQIKNKKILIKSEQGFGDIIQFSRFISLLESYTSKIDFLVPKQIGNLLKYKKANIIFKKKESYDYEIYLCSIPFLLNIDYSDLNNITYSNFKYQKNKHKYDFEKNKKFNVGLAWSGRESYSYDYLRSLKLDSLSPLLKNPKIKFFCLQKDIREIDKKKFLSSNISYWGDLNFEDLAKKMIELDFVISSDTSILHLSSSLKIKTLAMLPFVSDWRWPMFKNNSNWYKDLKIFRQKKGETWENVVEEINGLINKNEI